jgi:iron complex outermembrane receptor protein
MTTRPAWQAAALAAAALMVQAGMARAETGTDVVLPQVVVTATRSALALSEAPAAVSLVTQESIELRNVFRLGDALVEVPGLYLRGSALGESFPASGVGALTLRGIPRTPRTLVLIDGQPLNNALSGAVNFTGIPMYDVDRVEVVRGPFSALYGGHAMGGVVQVFTVAPVARAVFVDVGAGGGELPRQGYVAGVRDRLDDGLAWSLGAGYRRSDGWDGSDLVAKTPVAGTGAVPVTGALPTSTPDGRAAWLVGDKGARPWEQYNATLALRHETAGGARLAGGLAWSRYRVGATPPRSSLRDAAGREVQQGDVGFVSGAPVRLVLVESDFLTQTPSSEEEWRAYARAEVPLQPGVVLHASVGWLDHAFRFPQAGAGAGFDRGPGEFFDQPNQRADADVHVRIAPSPSVDVTAGGSLNRNHLDRSTWRVSDWRDFDSRTALTGVSDGTTWNAAAYVDAQWLVLPWLTLYGGARYDRFTTSGRIEQSTPPAFAADYPERSESQLSPKLAAVVALGRDATLRLSYGEGFRAPTLLDLYSRSVAPGASAGAPVVTEPAPDLSAERVRSLELGVDARLPTRTRVAMSLFAQRLSDLIYRERVTPVLNVLANVGAAKIDGVEVEVAQPLLGDRIRLHATATHLFRYDITRNEAVPASVGKRLTDVPQSLYTASVEGRWAGWSGSLAWRHASHVFGSGDDLNRNTVQRVFGSYDRYDAVSLKLARDVAPGVTASVAVDNLLDAEYFQFYRQPGRSVYFEVAVRR